MSEMQTWSTDVLPEAARFPAWSEKMRALHMDWDLAAPRESAYSARIRYRGTGSVRFADVRCAAFGGEHAPSSDAAGVVGVQLQLSGRMMCTYGDERFTVEPGDLFVWDSLRGGTFDSEGQRQLSLLVPMARVPQSVASMLGNCRPLAARRGAGALSLAASQFRGIARELEHLSDDAVNRAVDGLLDLLDSAVAPASATTPGHRAEALAAVQQHILDRLDDPGLSVSTIAASHWMSVRTLHLIFSESGTTVARWVRQQRLERCRQELVNASGATTVTSVATRWGFGDASHFSRIFKDAFGVPPTSVMRGSLPRDQT